MSDTTRRRVRCVLGSAAVLTMLTTTAVAAPVGAATVPSGGAAVPENPSARVAVLNLTGAQPDSATLPDDFAVSAGYVPGIRDGLLVDPSGDCSSPVPLPADFTVACQAHDLGYDLLRYAYDHGEPLGPWARQAVDAGFGRHLHTICAGRADTVSRLGCDLVATTADTAVDLNSRRQNYATPLPENLFGHQLSGNSSGTELLRLMGLAFALGALAGGLTLAGRRIAGRLRRKGERGGRLPLPSQTGPFPLGAFRTGTRSAGARRLSAPGAAGRWSAAPGSDAVRLRADRADTVDLDISRSGTIELDVRQPSADGSITFRPVTGLLGTAVNPNERENSGRQAAESGGGGSVPARASVGISDSARPQASRPNASQPTAARSSVVASVAAEPDATGREAGPRTLVAARLNDPAAATGTVATAAVEDESGPHALGAARFDHRATGSGTGGPVAVGDQAGPRTPGAARLHDPAAETGTAATAAVGDEGGPHAVGAAWFDYRAAETGTGRTVADEDEAGPRALRAARFRAGSFGSAAAGPDVAW
ncbi:hypothetical protein [Nocardia aurantia]|uniref:Uncharacterized protein n=1 Tax=Nocardia aurantia TaxID=2585199 RepID=A0A7K0DV33_9NOCA|nr:hypothetical protein [Nocardia aurantia]MQY29605.1 hypothetical protein [Nocardia aurantia]